MNEMHTIDFTIPLSGSQLFDTHIYSLALGLCRRFPGLDLDYEDTKHIRIFGQLSEMHYKEWTRAVLGLAHEN